jgi:hypothetical protein
MMSCEGSPQVVEKISSRKKPAHLEAHELSTEHLLPDQTLLLNMHKSADISLMHHDVVGCPPIPFLVYI